MKKKKGKDNYSYKRLILVSTMMFCVILSMITYWMYAYKYKHGYSINEKIVSIKANDYVDVNGDIVLLKNIDDDIITDFTKRQNSVINNNKIVDNKIDYGIYKNILSVKISYIIDRNSYNYEEIITLNVDLKNNKILTNDELLNILDITYKDIAIDIFDEYVKIPNDRDIEVIDSIDNMKMSSDEFNNNSEKYIIRIREKLPDIMNLYIENDKVYYSVRIDEINKLCYYMDNNIENINDEIGKI